MSHHAYEIYSTTFSVSSPALLAPFFEKTADFAATNFHDRFTQPYSIVGLAGCWHMLKLALDSSFFKIVEESVR
jgi:hypothetical protein